MQVTIDWIQLAELVGAVQGFLLAAVLIAHRTNRTANRLLAALMVAFTISLLSDVYYSAGLVRTHPHFFGVSYPLPWVFGPLVYLYALAASDRTWRFDLRAALHFAPPLAVVLLTLPVYLQSGAGKIALYDRLTAGDVPMLLVVLDPFKYVSGLAYSAATVAYLRVHRRRIEDSYSNTERVNLRWLQSLAVAAAAIWLLAVVTSMAGILPEAIARYGDDPVSLAVALFVYATGYKGLRQPEIFRYDRPEASERISTMRDDRSGNGSAREIPADHRPQESAQGETASIETASPEGMSAARAPSQSVSTEPASVGGAAVESDSAKRASVESTANAISFPAADRTAARYERSGLGEFETRKLEAALLALMARERPYRDPDLTLPALAERLNTTPHKLSEVLNRELAQTFHDFVNGYRVDEVRARLADPNTKHLNILALGLDAGFASKSTFNQVFKKVTGQTPSTYRKALEARKALAG